MTPEKYLSATLDAHISTIKKVQKMEEPARSQFITRHVKQGMLEWSHGNARGVDVVRDAVERAKREA